MHFTHGLAAVGLLSDLAVALRVLPLSISKDPVSPAQRRFRKRATYSETLANNVSEGSYIATVSVGTPAQTVQLAIDTGSSDVWVVSTQANLCTSQSLQENYGPCLTAFDSSKSSTFKVVSEGGFKSTYADGTGASGNYFTDAFSVGGASLKTLQMGIATKTTIPMGLMGIGFDTNEATTSGKVYPNLVDTMVADGLIPSKAYSLWLNDLQSSSGTILFGGLDTDKFIGSLKAVPIEPSTGGMYVDFTVALSQVSSTSGSNSTTFSSSATPVVLDSGTTLIYLPQNTIQSIYAQLNVYDDSANSGLSYADCNLLTQYPKYTFDFQFGGSSGPTVSVPINEIVVNDVQQFLDGSGSSGSSPGGQGGSLQLPPDLPFPASSACSFGIMSGDSGGSGESIYLLGDTFLRSAYVVYDLDNHQIALGQTDFNSSSSNVVEITSSSSAIPDVTGVASQVTVAQSATGLPGPGRETGTASGSSQSTGSAASGSSSASASAKNVAGSLRPPVGGFEAVAVACVAGLFALLGGAFMVL